MCFWSGTSALKRIVTNLETVILHNLLLDNEGDEMWCQMLLLNMVRLEPFQILGVSSDNECCNDREIRYWFSCFIIFSYYLFYHYSIECCFNLIYSKWHLVRESWLHCLVSTCHCPHQTPYLWPSQPASLRCVPQHSKSLLGLNMRVKWSGLQSEIWQL